MFLLDHVSAVKCYLCLNHPPASDHTIRTKWANLINTNPVTSARSSIADDDRYLREAARRRRRVFNHESKTQAEKKTCGASGYSRGVIKLKADRVKTLYFDLSPASRLEVTTPGSQRRLPG